MTRGYDTFYLFKRSTSNQACHSCVGRRVQSAHAEVRVGARGCLATRGGVERCWVCGRHVRAMLWRLAMPGAVDAGSPTARFGAADGPPSVVPAVMVLRWRSDVRRMTSTLGTSQRYGSKGWGFESLRAHKIMRCLNYLLAVGSFLVFGLCGWWVSRGCDCACRPRNGVLAGLSGRGLQLELLRFVGPEHLFSVWPGRRRSWWVCGRAGRSGR